MTDVIQDQHDDSLATRASLIERLKDCEDRGSWQEFYDRYRGLIFRFAVKAGCTETEADEVARTLGVSTAWIYLAKHRLGPLVKRRVAELERALNV
jgi:hypothetical protein